MKQERNYKGLVCLSALLIIAPYVTYKATFSGTVALWSSTKKIHSDISELRAVDMQVRADSAGASISNEDMIMNGALMAELEGKKTLDGLSVEKYTPYFFQEKDGLCIQTAEIILNGPYVDVLKAMRAMESGLPSCKISSVSFKSLRSRQNNDVQLQTTLILQQLTEK